MRDSSPDAKPNRCPAEADCQAWLPHQRAYPGGQISPAARGCVP